MRRLRLLKRRNRYATAR